MELRMWQASFSWLIFPRKRSRSQSFPRFPFMKTAEPERCNSGKEGMLLCWIVILRSNIQSLKKRLILALVLKVENKSLLLEIKAMRS